jgi:hypothetical protein
MSVSTHLAGIETYACMCLAASLPARALVLVDVQPVQVQPAWLVPWCVVMKV